MFAEDCNLDKKGLLRVAELDDYQIVANRERLKRNHAEKFAVVREDKDLLASVHETPQEAISQARELEV